MGTAKTASGWTVSCGSCGFAWTRTGEVSDYERQTLESRPCPTCGAYTLGCSDPQAPQLRRRKRDAERSRRAA